VSALRFLFAFRIGKYDAAGSLQHQQQHHHCQLHQD
jgi:hypothetical protein